MGTLQLVSQRPRKAGLQRSLVALMQRVEGPWKIHSPSAGRVHNYLAPRVLHGSCAPVQQILQGLLYALHAFLQASAQPLSTWSLRPVPT